MQSESLKVFCGHQSRLDFFVNGKSSHSVQWIYLKCLICNFLASCSGGVNAILVSSARRVSWSQITAESKRVCQRKWQRNEEEEVCSSWQHAVKLSFLSIDHQGWSCHRVATLEKLSTCGAIGHTGTKLKLAEWYRRRNQQNWRRDFEDQLIYVNHCIHHYNVCNQQPYQYFDSLKTIWNEITLVFSWTM